MATADLRQLTEALRAGHLHARRPLHQGLDDHGGQFVGMLGHHRRRHVEA